MSPDAVVLHPSSVTLSKAGDGLWVLSLPWLFGTVIFASLLLGDAELDAVRSIIIVVAVSPLVIVFGSPVLGRLPGLRWLLATLQPLATLDEDGMRMELPNVGRRRFGWHEIERLELHATWRRRWGELRGLDGSILATVPANLVYLKVTWRTAPTLAEAVVHMRPDLFVLTGTNWGGPDAFGRPGPEVTQVDAAVVARAHSRQFRGLLLALATIGAVLLLIMLLRPA